MTFQTLKTQPSDAPITPTQLRALREADASRNGLVRLRGGYGRDVSTEAFTIRTINALERDGLLEFVGTFNTTARITSAGRQAIGGEA